MCTNTRTSGGVRETHSPTLRRPAPRQVLVANLVDWWAAASAAARPDLTPLTPLAHVGDPGCSSVQCPRPCNRIRVSVPEMERDEVERWGCGGVALARVPAQSGIKGLGSSKSCKLNSISVSL